LGRHLTAIAERQATTASLERRVCLLPRDLGLRSPCRPHNHSGQEQPDKRHSGNRQQKGQADPYYNREPEHPSVGHAAKPMLKDRPLPRRSLGNAVIHSLWKVRYLVAEGESQLEFSPGFLARSKLLPRSRAGQPQGAPTAEASSSLSEQGLARVPQRRSAPSPLELAATVARAP
jgi:hypothetical protein